MINYIECAIIASHIYDTTREHAFGTTFKIASLTDLERLKSKLFTGWVLVSDVDSSMQPANHFYCALYLKFVEGFVINAVVAVRGTVINDWTNIFMDVVAWESDVLGDGHHLVNPIHYGMCISFLYKARQYLLNYFPKVYNYGRITLTGHSLGGGMAQLMTLKGMPYPAIVFNSPGCGDMSHIHTDMKHYVHSVNSRYGIINKIGAAVDKVNVIDVTQCEAEAKKIYDSFDVSEFDKGLHYEKEAGSGASALSALKDDLGRYYKADALYKTKNVVDSFPAMQSEYSKCDENHKVDSWYDLWNKLSRKVCKGEDLFSEYKKVIMAQHLIDNVVKALKKPQASGIAYKAVVS